MYFICCLIVFNILMPGLNAQDSTLNYNELYKQSDYIYTGVISTKYQLPYDNSGQLRMMYEILVTEIQKGPRRFKLLIETSDTTMVRGHEYLLFCRKTKAYGIKRPSVIHAEEVALNQANHGIHEVYKIVYKKIFRTIKKPIDPENMIPLGCGCH